MNARKKTVPCYAVNKSRHILSLSLIALLGAGALGTGPAFAADGIHCVRTIDYNKLSASELEMLYRDIDVHSFADNSANQGKCVAAIDYNKLSAATRRTWIKAWPHLLADSSWRRVSAVLHYPDRAEHGCQYPKGGPGMPSGTAIYPGVIRAYSGLPQ